MDKKIIVIGAGPAGLAAACSAVDSGVSSSDILVIERDSEPGGILNQCIHAGFGLKRFGEELTGPEYAGRYISMAKERNIEILCNAMVLELTNDKTVTFVSPQTGYTVVKAEAVILAMGCRERTRGALNIPGSRPSGVFTAGSAQRFLNVEGYMPGHRVVILGSGDIGLIMARRLTLEGAKVLEVCEIMPYSGGLPRNIVQCLDDFNIPIKLSHTIVGIHGNDRLEGVTVAEVDDEKKPIPGTEEYVECDTLLLSVGLIPENELTRCAGISIDSVTSGASVNQNRETNCPGVYACGNVLHVHDIVDFVSEEATVAGKAAADKVLDKSQAVVRSVKVIPGNGIKYTVPQRIDITEKTEDVRIFFRVKGIYKKVKLEVRGESVGLISVNRKAAVTPGEMESVDIKANDLLMLSQSSDNEIIVSLTEIGGNN